MEIYAWLRAYHEAWIAHNAEQVAQLFSEDAIYQSHPFRPPFQGRAEIQAYWRRSTPSQEELEVRWGTPIISSNHVAIEWWAAMQETDEGEFTLPRCLVVRFAENGQCDELREYWHVQVGGRTLPQAEWGDVSEIARPGIVPIQRMGGGSGVRT